MDARSAQTTTICMSFREAALGVGATILRGAAPTDPVLDFALSTAAGFASSPRRLECRFLYDEQGSALFERITVQPEYYLTRTETEILAASAKRIREITGPVTLVELGSGYSVKTEHLLRAWLARGRPVRYVPVDVSESALWSACRTISVTHPDVQVIGVNTEYPGAFPLFRELFPVLVMFLGSTIGNFTPLENTAFLEGLSAALSPGDFFLVGLDLVKEAPIIEAAYNDAAGVTGEFTRNLFARMNRELGSGIDLSAVQHDARYNPDKEQVEIKALFTSPQAIRIRQLEETFRVSRGETVRTEISRKFRIDRFVPQLEAFGFATEDVFIDDQGWFALVLARRVPLRAGGTA
ncbi:L-histidine N(alpha)-methyltransferase [Geobacter sp. SVR]|uniref:L-histidine N(alpha)-methyltransferase n=1 Tax=Geobacter sp. SVR TaxID=2495594 RepID=UPI00143F021E|nr:L-histidine N(alpha)-methyltransferase [Geobacter sp. SVR]BCS52710.1 histidine N-alpha-methyltransferase [Geobacter sp. SVR]GCF86794.1 dimethylhistidine N-methyltransferase [Geobacter sp. SVR]